MINKFLRPKEFTDIRWWGRDALRGQHISRFGTNSRPVRYFISLNCFIFHYLLHRFFPLDCKSRLSRVRNDRLWRRTVIGEDVPYLTAPILIVRH